MERNHNNLDGDFFNLRLNHVVAEVAELRAILELYKVLVPWDRLDKNKDLVGLPTGLELVVERAGEAVQVDVVIVLQKAVLAEDVARVNSLQKLNNALNAKLRVEDVVELVQVEVVELQVIVFAEIELIETVDAATLEELLFEDLRLELLKDAIDINIVEVKGLGIKVVQVQTVHIEAVVQIQVADVLGRRVWRVALSPLTGYNVRCILDHPFPLETYTGPA